MRDAVLDRPGLSERLSRAMTGQESGAGLPFRIRGDIVKSFAVEVNAPANDVLEHVQRIGEQHQMRFMHTHDSSLAIVWDEPGGLFVDVLDPRFWLVHTTAPMRWAQSKLRAMVSGGPSLDWCWLTAQMMARLRSQGEERWFKADFKGGELLPAEGTKGRRLKVQLEGDDPLDLQRVLRDAGYQSSTALTGVALRLHDPEVGTVDEAAYYRGSFSGRGDSFDLHLGFVSQVIQYYAARVRDTEERYGIQWTMEEPSGANLSGGVIEVSFARPITRMDQFLAGLFSCREPFRLWSVPRPISETFVEAEVVDLHVGQRFRMDITLDGLRVYLSRGACANTLFRLLANLQHRFDAASTATAELPNN